ncbi:hypothetical protein N9I90_05230 [Alphaproteobacteria bacterium]|nr:hypothetical protein [Alphaproteobacteria bacterium]
MNTKSVILIIFSLFLLSSCKTSIDRANEVNERKIKIAQDKFVEISDEFKDKHADYVATVRNIGLGGNPSLDQKLDDTYLSDEEVAVIKDGWNKTESLRSRTIEATVEMWPADFQTTIKNEMTRRTTEHLNIIVQLVSQKITKGEAATAKEKSIQEHSVRWEEFNQAYAKELEEEWEKTQQRAGKAFSNWQRSFSFDYKQPLNTSCYSSGGITNCSTWRF